MALGKTAPNSPAQILPAREKRFAIHFGRFEELVQRQRQLDGQLLRHTVVHVVDIQRRCVRIVVDAFGRQHLLDLGARLERRFDRFDLDVELGRILGGPVDDGREVLGGKKENALSIIVILDNV